MRQTSQSDADAATQNFFDDHEQKKSKNAPEQEQIF